MIRWMEQPTLLERKSMAIETTKQSSLYTMLMATVFVLVGSASIRGLAADDVDFLSDRDTGIQMRHHQRWGDLGFDTAAARGRGTGTPLRIGEKTYAKGMGHHANGEIVIDLNGRYSRFRTGVGVQWQGGKKGSVIFRVVVDGKNKFQTGPMSDSDPVRQVDVSLVGARELRLTADDAGDGIACDMANWVEACLVQDPRIPFFGNHAVSFDGEAAPARTAAAGGFALIARGSGPQVAVMETARTMTVSVERDEQVRWTIQVKSVVKPVRIMADVRVIGGGQAQVGLSLGPERVTRSVRHGERVVLATEPVGAGSKSEIVVVTRGGDEETGVRWGNLRYALGDQVFPIPMVLPQAAESFPLPVLPDLRPLIEQELVEWDWRMQDGIDTVQEPRTWQHAIETILQRGDRLITHLVLTGVSLEKLAAQWEAARQRHLTMARADGVSELEWEALWREVHALRRQIALANPLVDLGPLLFVKRVPSGFSHQLTQYAGRHARAGGGVFVLDTPGRSMRARRIDSLPSGSFLHPEVSWDGKRVLFAFCKTDPGGFRPSAQTNQYYHLFEMSADGSNLRQLTEGPFDDFSARYLPNGKIMFISTRRGGYHRCGRGPCPTHTLALASKDGSDPRVISFHETHEWDPSVLNDGRVIYTRWDYVDRHAVHYQQLWTVRPDGSAVESFYGNNTLNPVGVWEARAIPGSQRVMATAAAHHAMTSGSIILLDIKKKSDGLQPVTRLTPDALFPESEFPVGHWHAKAGVPVRPEVPVEEKRWPGHSYRTPHPLSEDFFLAAYSFDPLIGEPLANAANMFGVYLVDRFGNKELIYRDVSIGSLWPTPLRPRRRPPALASLLVKGQPNEGTFFMQNVYASWPRLKKTEGVVRHLRIVQVLPKTTPHSNTPRVGLANASPGKQVLGTVPVESDGSAYFRAPARIPLNFQALDDRGMAIQTMRSLTYLQPGEQARCVGCHAHHNAAPPVANATLASRREPSRITPGPDGSKPLNYAILVQPILDKHCIKCHGDKNPDGGIDLTSAPAGQFTRSYNALAPLVPYSEWKGTPQANHEPVTYPNQFGSWASRLMQLLSEGHEGVQLSEGEYKRLIIWMDTNALFYGTFDLADQRRQQRGERIAGPKLE
jgi:hypothetical protein